ncbi:MAG: hypothetical protein QOK43_128 [Acidimicrobiaceae bacterium]|nr:hypothetical protein [Acidimicrobiaceae bacterium]
MPTRTAEQVKAQAIKFRQDFGLPYDDTALAVAAASPDPMALQRYGVALTPAEYAEQSARDARADAAGPLAAVVEQHADELAGLWIDQQQGGMFVVMATPATSTLTRAAVAAAVPQGGTLRFEPAQLSTAALRQAAQMITDAQIDSTAPEGARSGNPVVALKSRGFTLVLSGVDEKANRIKVGFESLPDNRRDKLAEAWDGAVQNGSLPPRSLVEFAAAPLRPVDSRYDSPGTMKGGLELFGLRPGSTTTGSLCTSNLAATGGLQMTASHCYAPNTMVQHAGMDIGRVVYDGHFNNSAADVAGIQLNAGGLISPDMFAAFGCNGGPDTCQQIDTAGSVRNPILQNDRVCGGGRTTYWVVCGNVTITSATWTTTNLNDWRGGVSFQDQAVANIGLAGGDSGSVIGNGSVIFGITGGSDGVTTVFSKMHRALSQMGRGLITTRGWGLIQSIYSGKCADVAGNNSANGTQIWSWPCNGNVAQQWSIVPVGTMNGGGILWYELHRMTPFSKCMDLDIAQGGANYGAKIQEWDCNGGSNQKWRFVRNTTSTNPSVRRQFQIISQRSNNCVDLKINTPGGGYEDGAPLQQYICLGWGQTNQLWQVA